MKRLLILFSFSIVMFSCEKTVNDLEITSSKEITFTKNGGSSVISMTAYSDWTAKCDASWITVSPSSGTAGIDGEAASVKVTASTNTEYDDRSATVSITSNGKTFTVSVTQDMKTAVILSDEERTVDYQAQALVAGGKSNVDRKVEISSLCSSWIQYVPTRGLSSFDITLQISENDSESARTGEVYVRSVDSTVGDTIVITQKGKPSILFCSTPGIYKGRVFQIGFTPYVSQIGFFNWTAGVNEFQIVDASSRKFCLFKNLAPVGESGPDSPYPISVCQNMSSKLNPEFDLSLTVYKFEEGMIWAQDENKKIGVIIKVK